MFATREAFAVARNCPVIRREVTLSGMQVSAPAGGRKQIARVTCSRFSQCYGENRSIVPVPGCLLGNPSVEVAVHPKGHFDSRVRGS